MPNRSVGEPRENEKMKQNLLHSRRTVASDPQSFFKPFTFTIFICVLNLFLKPVALKLLLFSNFNNLHNFNFNQFQLAVTFPVNLPMLNFCNPSVPTESSPRQQVLNTMSRYIFSIDEDMRSISPGSLLSPTPSLSDLSESEGFIIYNAAPPPSTRGSIDGSSFNFEHHNEDDNNFRVGGPTDSELYLNSLPVESRLSAFANEFTPRNLQVPSPQPVSNFGYQFEDELIQLIDDDEAPLSTDPDLVSRPEEPTHIPQDYENEGQYQQQPQPLPPQTPLSAFHDPYAICNCCGQNSHQISLSEMNRYVMETHYPTETVRERDARARAFLDGIEVGVRLFSRGGLSRPVGIAGLSGDNSDHLTPSGLLQFTTPSKTNLWARV